jgi:hypothetical protein
METAEPLLATIQGEPYHNSTCAPARATVVIADSPHLSNLSVSLMFTSLNTTARGSSTLQFCNFYLLATGDPQLPSSIALYIQDSFGSNRCMYVLHCTMP